MGRGGAWGDTAELEGTLAPFPNSSPGAAPNGFLEFVRGGNGSRSVTGMLPVEAGLGSFLVYAELNLSA